MLLPHPFFYGLTVFLTFFMVGGGHAEESGSVCLETSRVLGWSESESEVKKM